VGRADLPETRSTVVVLSGRWEDDEPERHAVLRQIAGAIAVRCDVVVVTTSGDVPRHHVDGVFDIIDLGADAEGWRHVAPVLRTLDPVVVLVAGADAARSVPVVRDVAPRARLVAVPLIARCANHAPVAEGTSAAPATPTRDATCDAAGDDWIGPLVAHADAVLVATRGEGDRVRAATGAGRPTVAVAGPPVPVSDDVHREPFTGLAGHTYLAVLTGAQRRVAGGGDLPVTRMLISGAKDRPVAVELGDHVELWHGGGRLELPPAMSGTDLGRLLAWARATVDLRPGAHVARESILSLRCGTPIVVPAGSVGHEHARAGAAGLWFHNLGELAAAAVAVFDEDTSAALGSNGRIYAAETYGSTEEFVRRVQDAAAI
jgi:hypothetical protein